MASSTIHNNVKYCSAVKVYSTITMSGTSITYTVPEDGIYAFMFVANSSTAHDMAISMDGFHIAEQYSRYAYVRLNLTIPLKAGVVLTFTGISGDGIYIRKIY